MKTYIYKDLDAEQKAALIKRGHLTSESVVRAVEEIGYVVKQKGDAAIREFNLKFGGIELEDFLVSEAEFLAAENAVSREFKDALNTAKENIYKFHASQIKERVEAPVETTPGVTCWREFKAIESVGLYVPGGSAPLFSTVLMLGIPAITAGAKQITLCTPPAKDGSIAPEILYACASLGLKQVFKIGGAQAVFAMAYGTVSVPKADKIFGPGNQYVMEAKMQVSSMTAIDMPAGPSEVLVVADENANAAYAAADILSQAEHGETSQSVLVCNSEEKIKEILAEVDEQLKKLPRKKEAKRSLENSYAVLESDRDAALDFINAYAPEHLIINTQDAAVLASKIQNAGSVFIGPFSSESFGDYASGTNHTLPTSGFARSYSGLNLEAYGKWVTFQEVKKEGLVNLGQKVVLMAQKEGLDAHANAVRLRLEGEKND